MRRPVVDVGPRISLRTVQKHYPVFDKESLRTLFRADPPEEDAELHVVQGSDVQVRVQEGAAPQGALCPSWSSTEVSAFWRRA